MCVHVSFFCFCVFFVTSLSSWSAPLWSDTTMPDREHAQRCAVRRLKTNSCSLRLRVEVFLILKKFTSTLPRFHHTQTHHSPPNSTRHSEEETASLVLALGPVETLWQWPPHHQPQDLRVHEQARHWFVVCAALALVAAAACSKPSPPPPSEKPLGVPARHVQACASALSARVFVVLRFF